MQYNTLGEALSCHAFTTFSDCYGVEALSLRLKVWDCNIGWKSDGSIVVCSEFQYRVATHLGWGSFRFSGDHLVIEEKNNYRIWISPNGKIRYSLEALSEYEMAEWICTYSRFQEIFELCQK